MGNIIRPSYKAGLARNASESANPHLWRGLVNAWVPALGVTGNTAFDMSERKNFGVLQNQPTWNPIGSIDFNIGSSQSAGFDFDKSGTFNYPFSITITGRASGTGVFGAAVVISDNTSDAEFIILTLSNPGAGNLPVVQSESGGSSDSLIGVTDLNDGEIHSLVGVWHHSTKREIYVDQKLEGTSAASVMYPTSANRLNVCLLERTTDFFYEGVDFKGFLIHNRALSSTERKQLHIDPLAPFRLRDRFAGLAVVPAGRIMGSLAGHGGLAGIGGIAGQKGGIAG